MKRTGMRLVYVGDVGVIPEHSFKPIPDDIDIESLSMREMFSILVEAGVPPKEIIGVKKCIEHLGMIWMRDNLLPPGFSMAEDCVICRNCFRTFRNKERLSERS